MGQFRGDFSIMSLSDLFQHLVNGRKQGTLTVTDGESRKVIHFGADSFRVLSEGSHRRVRLGDTLLRRKRLTTAQLQRALETQAERRCRLGEALVHLEFLTEREILDVVREQIEEEIYDLFTWQHAWFEFVEGAPPPILEGNDDAVAILNFDVMSVLMEAARRLDEWKMIRAQIPDDDATYRLNVSGQQFARESQEDAVLQRVAFLLDGHHTLRQVVDQSGFPRFEVYRLLYALHLQQVLDAVGAPRPASAAPAAAEAPHARPPWASDPEDLQTLGGTARGILVISSSPAARSVLGADLRRARYRVVEASDTADAAAKIERERVHAILIDSIGDMSGVWTACRAIANVTSLPIFVLGTSRRREDIAETIRIGARDYLLKPLPGTALLDRLSKLWKEGPTEKMGDLTLRLQRKKRTPEAPAEG